MSLNKKRQLKKKNIRNLEGIPYGIHFSLRSLSILKKTIVKLFFIYNSTSPNTFNQIIVDIFQETARFGNSFTVTESK